jgi:SPP1 gp7 family putative phage head morphogenesis protein
VIFYRKVINAKKYFGTGTLIEKYGRLISDAVQPEKLEQLLPQMLPEKESNPQWDTIIAAWQKEIQDRLAAEIPKKVDPLFNKAYERGAKRLLDPRGKPFVLGVKVKDTRAIVQLVSSQLSYVNNLTDEMRQVLLDEITKGLNQGLTYSQIAKNVTARVSKLSEARARTIARSEITKAHGLGMEAAFKEAGVTRYYWVTQNDLLVCKTCRGYEKEGLKREGFTVGAPDSPRPVTDSHPNCRCVPVMAEEPKQEVAHAKKISGALGRRSSGVA